MALGSLRECSAILELEKIQNLELMQTIDHLGAILYTLSRKAPKKRNRTETETATETATDNTL